jgi:orotate phosphoribosyltransferase
MNDNLLSSVNARRGHFKLESGHHGELWLQLETLCLRPRAVVPFAAQLAKRLAPYEVEVVCGPLIEGSFVALLAASELGCDFTYAERFADSTRDVLFPVEYRLPQTLGPVVRGRRVAIVNDVISAGSAVRGTLSDLEKLGARVVAIGALLVLGDAFVDFAAERQLPLEALQRMPYSLWPPAQCPLCIAGEPLEILDNS